MSEKPSFWSSLLCHEAITFLIYGTFGFLLLLYIPYWIRQQIDKQFLKSVGKFAQEKHLQEKMKAAMMGWESESEVSEYKSYKSEEFKSAGESGQDQESAKTYCLPVQEQNVALHEKYGQWKS